MARARKTSKFVFVPGSTSLEAMTTIDGTQVWRNPRLRSFSQEITAAVGEFRMNVGGTYCLFVNAINTGTETWFGGGQAMTIAASYRWVDGEGKTLLIEGERTQLGRATVHPGENEPIHLKVVAPVSPGSYFLFVSMVQEGFSGLLTAVPGPWF